MKEEEGTCTYIHFTYPRTADNNRQGKGMQKLQSNKLVFNRFFRSCVGFSGGKLVAKEKESASNFPVRASSSCFAELMLLFITTLSLQGIS